jgi:hypothetical protein
MLNVVGGMPLVVGADAGAFDDDFCGMGLNENC